MKKPTKEQTDMPQELYALTKVILMLGYDFAKVDAHDKREAESADHLWIESTPEDDLSEGEVISISPANSDKNHWHVACHSAHRVGGWSTHWFSTGTAIEIQSLVARALGVASVN